MTTIRTYQQDWYKFTSVRFQLRAFSQVAPRVWAGGNAVYGPHAQVWMPKFASSITEETVWPDIAAFFEALGGQAGLMRMGDPSRLICRYNRAMISASQNFSDGTAFTDGTGFIDGMMPPAGHLLNAAQRGDTHVVIGGLLPSTTAALQRGDLIEFKPNGIADEIPRLHSVVRQGNTDSGGLTGVEIRPPLRAGLAAGDMASIENATSVFHVIDDGQGEVEVTPPLLATFGFSLVEAIENI